MATTVKFGKNIIKYASEKYLSDFLSYAESSLHTEYPNLKLELYSFTGDINNPSWIDIEIDLEKNSIGIVMDNTKYGIGHYLKNLFYHYSEINPYNTEDK